MNYRSKKIASRIAATAGIASLALTIIVIIAELGIANIRTALEGEWLEAALWAAIAVAAAIASALLDE